MPLDQFRVEGRPIGIRVKWHDETLWFVPGLPEVKRLVERGVDRGRIWTAGELADLMTIPAPREDAVQTLAQIKVRFGGEVSSVALTEEPLQ